MAVSVTNHATNSTQSSSGECFWQAEYLTATTIVISVFAASVQTLISAFTILLNMFIILAVRRKSYLRKKKHCVLLACLAATDLLVGTVVLPLVITGHVLRITGVGPICPIDEITTEVARLAVGASFFHLVIISGERYICIKHALRYETLVTTSRLTKAVVVAWAVPVFNCSVYIPSYLVGESVLREQLFGLLSLLTFLSGLLAVSFCQVALLLESQRHRKHIKAQQVSESSTKEFLKKNKAARTTTIVIGFLCLCFTPLMIFEGVVLLKNVPRIRLINELYLIEIALFINSLINPIIYCIRTQEFQRAFKELLKMEDPQTNVDVGARKTGCSRRQQEDNDNARVDSSTKMAWPKLAGPSGTRSGSLDLSKVSSLTSRRTNSV